MSAATWLEIKLLHSNAKIPTKLNEYDAGYDLYAIADGYIEPNKQECIPLGFAISIPNKMYGRIAPRSSLALKYGIDIMAGVIDPGYKDEVCVILRNHGTKTYEYKIGDRIAQLIITLYDSPPITVVKQLSSKDRGGGFGSTGV